MHKQLLKFPGLNHRFVEAIDGHLVDHEELEDIGIYDSRANLKPGEIGVYLTHLREAAEQAQKSGQITVTFEDDIVLPDNFEEMFRRALSNAPDDWDILYLGCYQNHYADERGVVNNEWSSRFFYPLCPPSALTRVADFWSQMRQRCIAGTWAYVLNQKGAQKLANELIPIQIPIDVRIAELVGQGKLVAYCASPELLSLDGDLPSTIR